MSDLTLFDADSQGEMDDPPSLILENREENHVETSWDDAYDEELGEALQSSQEVEAACEISPQSSTESESESGRVPKLVLWWAQLLQSALRSLGFEWNAPDPSRPVTIVTACTGCSAECAVFKALRINHAVISASEKNASYREFCKANYASKFHHFYETVEEQIAQSSSCTLCRGGLSESLFGPCQPLQTLRECAGDSSTDLEPDLMFAGSPCLPFSQQRAKRWHTGDVKTHESYGVTMQSMIDLCKLYEPKKMMLEQVKGFCMPYEKGGTMTPKERFLELMGAQDWRYGGYWVASLELHGELFIKVLRTRYCLTSLTSKKAGGASR